jgi:hypothetical protein
VKDRGGSWIRIRPVQWKRRNGKAIFKIDK